MTSENTTTNALSPLTLQQQSFLFVLSHLQDYPISHLALLPKRWREALLTMAPLGYLLQLERTAVADRIDTEAVWEAGSSLIDSVWASYTLMDSIEDQWRDCYVSYLCHLLINTRNQAYIKKRIFELLYGIHRDKIPVGTAMLPSLFIPLEQSYYRVPFYTHNCCTSVEDIALFFVHHLALPTVLDFCVSTVMCGPLWKRRENGLLEQLLSNVRSLRLSGCYKHKEAASFALQAATANTASALEWLEIWDANDSVLMMILELLHSPCGYTHLVKLAIVRSQALQLSLPDNYYISSIGPSLSSMIEHHVALEQLTLHSLYCDSGAATDALVSSLATLLLRPQFEKLTLQKCTNMPLRAAKALIAALLAAFPSNQLKLCFADSEIVCCPTGSSSTHAQYFYGESQLPKPSPSRLHGFHKHLHLNSVELPSELIEWLSEFDFIYLHTLSLDDIYITDHHPQDLKLVLLQHPQLMIKKFHFFEREIRYANIK